MESGLEPDVLVVDYHDFFGRPESCIPLMSDFLELEFDEPLRETWREMSCSFGDRRRAKEPPSQDQQEFVREHKDNEAEQWILDVIEQQRTGPVKLPSSEHVDRRVHEDQISDLEARLLKERRKSRQLRERNRRLKSQIREPESQAQTPNNEVSSIRARLARLKARILGKH